MSGPSVFTRNPEFESPTHVPTIDGKLEGCPPVYAAEQDGSALGNIGARMEELSLGSITEHNALILNHQEEQVRQEENDGKQATEEQLEDMRPMAHSTQHAAPQTAPHTAQHSTQRTAHSTQHLAQGAARSTAPQPAQHFK